ncbi:MAG: hypothetical protein AAF533_08915 [Acidobacteriota bacterium]
MGDECDNCLEVSNVDQLDTDADGLGDACDPCPTDTDNDSDADGVCNDGDGDGTPGNNPCPDGVTAGCDDNCPDRANPGQEDDDGDGEGNECEPMTVEPPEFLGLLRACETRAVTDDPTVTLEWEAATGGVTPPITYSVYRSETLPIDPMVDVPVATGLMTTSFEDVVVTCATTYHYLVRAQDSSMPPAQDDNVVTVSVDVICADPLLPDPSPHLRVTRDESDRAVLDWSGFVAPPQVARYHVRKTTVAEMIPGDIDVTVGSSLYVDPPVAAELVFYDVRSVLACGDGSIESRVPGRNP